MNKLNLLDQKFGRLLVIKLNGYVDGCSKWKCLCSCGKKTIVSIGDLRSGHTQSCGCLHLENLKSGKCHFKHGMEGTNFYGRWGKMLRRIRNKNCKEYKYYGGRGIKVCDKWLDFKNFRDDMYESYLIHCKKFGKRNTTIERTNVNGDYCPENCKWDTWQNQKLNKTNSKKFFS
jgi:hypothetical protein